MTAPGRIRAGRILAAIALATATAACTTSIVPSAADPTTSSPAWVDTAGLGAPDAELLLDTTTTIAGEPITYPTGPAAQIVSQIVTLEPGQSTGWHRHGVPTFGYVLSGRIEVEYDGGVRRTFEAGDRLMEAMRTAHNGANTAATPVRILVVYMGANGEPRTMTTPPPAMPADLSLGKGADLVELEDVESQLKMDLRYATADNFTGRTIYRAARAFLQRPAAEALQRAGRRAREKGYGLLVLDAYRPWSVTRMFWDSFPTHRAYLADPLQGSRHNRGCAVDLTLFDPASGKEVRMPSAYDDFSERAHPAYTGAGKEETKARDLLRTIMEAEGFTVYENEWWHFDYQGWRDYAVLDRPIEP